MRCCRCSSSDGCVYWNWSLSTDYRIINLTRTLLKELLPEFWTTSPLGLKSTTSYQTLKCHLKTHYVIPLLITLPDVASANLPTASSSDWPLLTSCTLWIIILLLMNNYHSAMLWHEGTVSSRTCRLWPMRCVWNRQRCHSRHGVLRSSVSYWTWYVLQHVLFAISSWHHDHNSKGKR